MRNEIKLFIGASILILLAVIAFIFFVFRNRETRIVQQVMSPAVIISPTPMPQVSFIIGGDMMFGRLIAHTFEKGGLWHALDQLPQTLFADTDASVINLEGAISDVSVVNNPGPTFTFIFPPDTIEALKYLGIQAVSLANNHSNNAGVAGLATTRSLLEQAGIQWFGGPSTSDTVYTATFKGQELSLTVIGIHTLIESPDIVPLIQKIKQDRNQRIIIFPHWGVEYAPKHNNVQEQLAHTWIDAGADLVIGSHPHVIQDSELYHGKPIVYSIGNFLFDQTWSIETQRGALVRGVFTENDLELSFLPIVSKNYKPYLADTQFNVVASAQWIPFSF